MATGDPQPVLDLRSPDRSEYIRFSLISFEPDVYPSVEVDVEAHTNGFSGHTSAWLAHDAVTAFAEELNHFELTRKGSVQLVSMTPDELRLALSSMDASGHVLVEFAFRRYSFVGDRRRTAFAQLSGAFELEPSSLPALVVAFRTLVVRAET
jgi:hypothetical protein